MLRTWAIKLLCLGLCGFALADLITVKLGMRSEIAASRSGLTDLGELVFAVAFLGVGLFGVPRPDVRA